MTSRASGGIRQPGLDIAEKTIFGSGEMADLTRAFDWSQTPVGSVEQWPIALLTTVNLLLASRQPMLLFWGEDLIQFYNDAFRPSIGKDKHPSALGQRGMDTWHEIWPVIYPQIEAVMSQGESCWNENQLIPILRDGRLEDVYWTYSYSPVRDANGKICGTLVTCSDTTGRVLIERQLQQVLEVTTDGILAIDRNWTVTYINSRGRNILMPSGELTGRHFWEIFPSAVYEGSPFLEHYYKAMDHDLAGDFEAYYPEPLNSWYHVLTRPTPDGIIVFFRNVTEQRRATAALLQSEKLAAVGRLASSIAHEINNPLESVTNLLFLARDSKDLPEIQSYLDTADRELSRVSAIANQTLRFHKQSTSPTSISCENLFAGVLSVYQGHLWNRQLIVEKRKLAIRPVMCFEGEIRQVLSNLVGNAIDAMAPARGGRLLLRSREGTDWKSGRKGLILTVADTGPGMPPQTARRAFEPFFTTKDIAGTGLGLWVSQEIVSRHNGRLRFRSSESPEHHGTVFTLFLPFEATTR